VERVQGCRHGEHAAAHDVVARKSLPELERGPLALGESFDVGADDRGIEVEAQPDGRTLCSPVSSRQTYPKVIHGGSDPILPGAPLGDELSYRWYQFDRHLHCGVGGRLICGLIFGDRFLIRLGLVVL
jgi:hypothetical protein